MSPRTFSHRKRQPRQAASQVDSTDKRARQAKTGTDKQVVASDTMGNVAYVLTAHT